MLFFGLVAVGGVYYLQTLSFELDALVAGLQVGFLSTVLIAINNARDAVTDQLVAKKTLAVRFGIRFVRFEVTALVLLTFGLCGYWILTGYILVGVLPLVTLHFFLRVAKDFWKEPPGPVYNELLAQAAGAQLLFAFQMTLGFLLDELLVLQI